jgi:hypothetical protein
LNELIVSQYFRNQAERAIASVVEAECPLCKVELRVHDGRACCPCCGDSYTASPHRLDVKRCPEQGTGLRALGRSVGAARRLAWRLLRSRRFWAGLFLFSYVAGTTSSWASVVLGRPGDAFFVVLTLLWATFQVVFGIYLAGHPGYWIDNLGWLTVGVGLWLAAVLGAFAETYLTLARDVSGSFTDQSKFTSLDAAYVAITTFTSVGSGALQPIGQWARATVMVESAVALISVGVGLALVVAAVTARHRSGGAAQP